MKSFKSYVENRDLNEMARVSSSTFPEKVADPRLQEENEKALEKSIQIVQQALDDNSQAYNNLWRLLLKDDNPKNGMVSNDLLAELDRIRIAMINRLGNLHIKKDTEIFNNLYYVLHTLHEGKHTGLFLSANDENVRDRHYDNDYRFLVKNIIKTLESIEKMLLEYKAQGDVYPKKIDTK